MLPEAVGVMMLVVEAFDRHHIPYLVGGSMASALHGVTRSTIDADMIAEIVPEQVQELVKMLGSDFYVGEEMILDAIHHQRMDLFDHALQERMKTEAPLAARMRPRTLDEAAKVQRVVGQEEALQATSILIQNYHTPPKLSQLNDFAPLVTWVH